MDYVTKRRLGNGRRAGDSFATLLFVVVAIALTATTLMLTDAFLGSRDTTMTFVPMNATVYVHSNGYSSTEALLSSSSGMPSGIHPYEFALFIAPGDDVPQRGTILAWGTLKKPNATELGILKERGATKIDDRHYFFGDASLATAAKVAAAAHASLADDGQRHAALNAMRELFSVQILANPRQAVHDAGSPLVDDLLADISPESAVVGVALRDRSFIARVTPLSVPMSRSIDHSVAAELDPTRINADAVITEISPDFNFSKLFAFDSANRRGVTDDMLAESDDALRAALGSPFALWLREATAAQPAPTFLLHFPHIAPQAAAAAIMRTFAIRNPTSQDLTLPDGSTATELRIDELLSDSSALKGDLILGGPGGKIMVGSDNENGSLISSDSGLFNEYRHPKLTHQETNDPCGRSANKLTINDTTLIKEKNAAFSFIVDKTGINAVSFNMTEDNELFFCGYRK